MLTAVDGEIRNELMTQDYRRRPGAPVTNDATRQRRQELADRVERAVRLPMTLLAIAFVLAIVLPELADVPPELEETLEVINWLIWAVFAFELGLMTYLSADRRRYLMTHWVDVLTVLLPFLRPFRLLRIVIVSARLWVAVKVLIYQRTFSTVAMTGLLSSVAAATLVYAVERGGEGPIQTYADALWWAAVTVTTVGYGDVYPKTPAGRGIAFLLMLIGISMFGLLTARIAAFFVEASEEDTSSKKLDEVLARLERLERELRQTALTPSSPLPDAGEGEQGGGSLLGPDRDDASVERTRI
jgi:voltage-gated potassium channel